MDIWTKPFSSVSYKPHSRDRMERLALHLRAHRFAQDGRLSQISMQSDASVERGFVYFGNDVAWSQALSVRIWIHSFVLHWFDERLVFYDWMREI